MLCREENLVTVTYSGIQMSISSVKTKCYDRFEYCVEIYWFVISLKEFFYR